MVSAEAEITQGYTSRATLDENYRPQCFGSASIKSDDVILVSWSYLFMSVTLWRSCIGAIGRLMSLKWRLLTEIFDIETFKEVVSRQRCFYQSNVGYLYSWFVHAACMRSLHQITRLILIPPGHAGYSSICFFSPRLTELPSSGQNIHGLIFTVWREDVAEISEEIRHTSLAELLVTDKV